MLATQLKVNTTLTCLQHLVSRVSQMQRSKDVWSRTGLTQMWNVEPAHVVDTQPVSHPQRSTSSDGNTRPLLVVLPIRGSGPARR